MPAHPSFLPSLLQNRYCCRDSRHCRKGKLKACITNILRIFDQNERRSCRQGCCQIRRPACKARSQKQAEHDQRAAGGDAHSRHLGIGVQKQRRTPGCGPKRRIRRLSFSSPFFFPAAPFLRFPAPDTGKPPQNPVQDSEHSHPDQRQMQSRNTQQMTDPRSRIQGFYLLIHLFFDAQHHGGCRCPVLFPERLEKISVRPVPDPRQQLLHPAV